MKYLHIGLANYRCFSDAQGMSSFDGVNIIIGRNNSGKSRLLDLVRYLCEPSSVTLTEPAHLLISAEFEAEDFMASFQSNVEGGDIQGNHLAFAQQYVGAEIQFQKIGSSASTLLIRGQKPNQGAMRFEQAASRAQLPLHGKYFLHIAAERSIRPEPESANWISPDGGGATAVIQRYLTDSRLSSALVEDVLLRELNLIFEPDNRFTRILVQRHADANWEIYLEEEGKGRIPLSASGSGLQTILLILLSLHVFPEGNNLDRSNLVVAIEEPENNLHPAIQRRLLSYIQKYSRSHQTPFFVTTHSTVAIDQFVGQKDARLLHVRHDGNFAKVGRVEAYTDGHEILRDLDVRPSDLLQSNGIIWVEGPTDRLYINKWIEILSGGRLREGAHYQCVFYGGKLLSHLSASGDLGVRKELIDLITINKSAAIVIDSDRRNEKGKINTTKRRISAEFEAIGALVWITKGREIENYIHSELLEGLYGTKFRAPSSVDSVMDWVLENPSRKKKTPDKITLASKISERCVTEDVLNVMDLRERMLELIEKIEAWNNMARGA